MKSPISTFARYIYLNLYALLLLLGGVVVFLIPIKIGAIWVLIAKIIICLICLKGAYGILSSWEDKKRKYNILITRNQDAFRADIFKEYMEAPCGRLLVKIVLKDLGQPHQYKPLMKLYYKPFWKYLKATLKPQKTVIYINPNYEQKDQH